MDVDAAVAQLSAAIRERTAAGDPRAAAMACARLGDLYANAMGNLTAARAWFARAERLVADEEPCLEQGWVAVAPLGCMVDDPADLLARAELALDRARRFGDERLETKALADAGLAHVQAGRVAEGMALLDEAMALACAAPPPTDPGDATPKSVCSFFTACYFTADFDRAASWAPVFRQRGMIGPHPNGAFLSNHCDSVQAAMLIELGQWGEAEALLLRAMAEFSAALGGVAPYHAAIALGDLRVRQGRLAEAEQLLLGRDAALEALLPAARLHLARGDVELARAAASRALRAVGDDRLRAVQLLTVVVDAELARGDVEAAAAAADELAGRVAGLDRPMVAARTVGARARVLAAQGDLAAAIALVEAAVDSLASAGAPWLRATLLLQLAGLRERQGDRATATVEAKAASAILADLDVVLAPGDAELLRRLCGGPAAAPATLTRDGKWWEARCGDTCVRLPDTKGLRYVAELVAAPGMERHALDLVDRVEGTGDVDRRTLGDAGDVADPAARTAYRRRIEALRAEIDDALAVGAAERAEALQDEVDQLIGQLATAFGLGGRSRKASSAAEKARLNVTRAVRAATAKLAEALPEAGAALDRRVRTGTYAAYEPEDGDIRWIVQS